LAMLAVAVVAAACGETSQAAAPSPSPSPVVASPTPPPRPRGLTFRLVGIHTSAAGTIHLTKGEGTVMLELQITGLAADSQHVSHIHIGSCQQTGAIIYALNPVIADGTGVADTTSLVHATHPPASGHWYVVVHAGPDMQGANATYLLCGNLF